MLFKNSLLVAAVLSFSVQRLCLPSRKREPYSTLLEDKHAIAYANSKREPAADSAIACVNSKREAEADPAITYVNSKHEPQPNPAIVYPNSK
ncbi:hypothetical protein BBP40_005183 [Aspergillus hancockii]|nr:hypothetical protein BBP40_005183 [Aspergillus hancockii]